MSYGDDYGDAGDRRLPSQTRTRLPEEREAGPRRPAASPRRSLMTIVGVVVLLIAAIVFANQAGDTEGSGSDPVDEPGGGTQAQPTAPTGELPVDTSTNGIPSGFPQTEQGAQSAAANYAVALISPAIVRPAERSAVVDHVFTPDKASEMSAKMDETYSSDFLGAIGLDPEGTPPEGMTYVSRTAPVGTEVVEFNPDSARVDVWCTGLFGMAGTDSTHPVASDWFTMTFELRWSGDDWKVHSFAQLPGPAPVPGDNQVSSAADLAEALTAFGGFTYAR
ncbi:hypothetical protein PJ985_21945 [Streptomyces sp. ACA25]|uniref:hypothetical protein n=1 Tax=Streptomyces sp. ACA25 TaxID=3022596 RepID=UPI0023070C95|nr:hypothetical protein [Streptomyces sp. ACA25]MDB1090219.1 hypothetical protein [Streptomyces sp. ACA25]